MKVDGTTYGIIPDTFPTILSNYLNPLQSTFPNANSPNDPIYTLAYVTSTQDQVIQSALCSLWNAINANTAEGLGLDILASTILNLTRNDLIPSSCGLSLTIGPIYSSLVVQVVVSAATSGGKLPSGSSGAWTVTGSASPSPNYSLTNASDYTITNPGTYYVTVYSTDTTTPIPVGAITSSDPGTGVTITSVTNLTIANLGSLTIPTTVGFSVSTLGSASPFYYLSSPVTYTKAGVYNVIAYSQNITTPVFSGELNTASDSLSYPSGFPHPNSKDYMLLDVFNIYDAILGVPAETDAQFSARRRYYLNVEGSTYYGLEKAITDLEVPALESVFIDETIGDDYNASICLMQLSLDYSVASTIVIPVGWTVYGTATSYPYKTIQAYTFTDPGGGGTAVVTVPVFSQDMSTVVDIGGFTTADAPYPSGGVTAVTNLSPSVPKLTVGLGERGYTVYLEYPTIPYSTCGITLSLSAFTLPGPYYIPIGWTATGPTTTAPYQTQQSYIVTDADFQTGYKQIVVSSTDVTTAVAASTFTSGDAVSGLTFTVDNPSPAVLGNTNPGQFDVNDLYLQQIAQTCYNYHPLGTQFYPGANGATSFTVQTPYQGYTYDVILNPFTTIQATCNLLLVYNITPSDAGYGNGVFDTSLLPNLAVNIQQIINQYFLSKTLPTDLIYSTNELSEIIQNTYSGIVALIGNGSSFFSLGTVSPSTSNKVFLHRSIGANYYLDISNFNFVAKDKNSL